MERWLRLSDGEQRFGLAAVALLLMGVLLSGVPLLGTSLIQLALLLLSALFGKVASDWRLRSSTPLGHDRLSHVYRSRTGYAELVPRLAGASELDLMGMSLGYALEYMHDNSRHFFLGVDMTRVLLPANDDQCFRRDQAQGATAHALATQVAQSRFYATELARQYPTKFEVRFFVLDTYCAVTRIDDLLYASPYVSLSGGSSPMLVCKLGQPSPGGVGEQYLEHFERVWTSDSTQRSDTT